MRFSVGILKLSERLRCRLGGTESDGSHLGGHVTGGSRRYRNAGSSALRGIRETRAYTLRELARFYWSCEPYGRIKPQSKRRCTSAGRKSAEDPRRAQAIVHAERGGRLHRAITLACALPDLPRPTRLRSARSQNPHRPQGPGRSHRLEEASRVHAAEPKRGVREDSLGFTRLYAAGLCRIRTFGESAARQRAMPALNCSHIKRRVPRFGQRDCI